MLCCAFSTQRLWVWLWLLQRRLLWQVTHGLFSAVSNRLIMITHLGSTWTSLSSSNRESMVFRPFIGFQLRNVKLRKKCFDHYIYRRKEICKGENIGLDILIYKKCHKFEKVTVYHLFHYFTAPSFFPITVTTLYLSNNTVPPPPHPPIYKPPLCNTKFYVS